jgi:hypothetical protein
MVAASRFFAAVLVVALVSIIVFVWLASRPRPQEGLLPYPGKQPKTLDGFLRLFATSGVLVHMLSPEWIQAFLGEGRTTFTLDADCDPTHSCAAYTFWQQRLPLAVVSFAEQRFQFGLCYDAAALWAEVMCMSVFDANTSNRNCCTCSYNQNCVDSRLCAAPTCAPPFKTPYCKRVCDQDRTCRALNAGCGPNLWALKYSGRCTPDSVYNGQCQSCSAPQWCAAEGVDDGDRWLKQFLAHGGHGNQCRFSPDQKDLWYRTMLDFYSQVQTRGAPADFVSLENEVNFYLNSAEPDYATTHDSFMDGMMAILYLPNNVAPGQVVSPTLLDDLRALRSHLQPLVGDVPILQMNVEAPLSLTHWKSDEAAELVGGYYDLQVTS